MRRIDVDPSCQYVLLTLWSGTQPLDTGDRITVGGAADDVAISEMVACAARRSWQAVDVSGPEEFRTRASRAFLLQGIAVVDCPPSEAEQATLRGKAWGGLIGSRWKGTGKPVPAPRRPWAYA